MLRSVGSGSILLRALFELGWGYGGAFFAGHAFWAEVGGDIAFVALGEFLGSLKKVL